MANEFEIQNNPDNVPGAVSTGYQRQNVISEINRQGIDNSAVTLGATDGDIIINISGGVDVNGVLYSCKTSKTLTVPTGTYYIRLAAGSTTNFLSPELLSVPGALSLSKNGYYYLGDRVLDWVIISDGVSAPCAIYRKSKYDIYSENINSNKIITNDLEATRIKTDGTFFATKVVSIGTWNMPATAFVDVAHGLPDNKKIRSVNVMIRNDADTEIFDLSYYIASTNVVSGGVNTIDSTNIRLVTETTSGAFSSSDFSGTILNRGWVTIKYEL